MTTLAKGYRMVVALLVGTLLLALSTTANANADRQSHTQSAPKPTIVLVHGAFADASGWSAEIRYLHRHGYRVIAPANPLRGLTTDADYIRSILATIDGPVVLVGHSYGGSVITNAARGASNVKALVYVSAFMPAAKESTASVLQDTQKYPGSLLSMNTLLPRPTYNPSAPGGKDADLYINPMQFRAIFAGDQTPTNAAVLAAEQRPVSAFAYNEPSGQPAWATLPSWALVSLDDRAISPKGQLFMAHRAGSHIVAIHSAHDSLITHPCVVDRLIEEAAHAVR